MDDDEEPRDPFRDETPFGPWHHSLRQGEMLLKAFAELPDIAKVIVATERMSKDDLRSIVLERLYVWHASKQPSGWFDVQDWLSPKDPDS